MSIKFLLYFHIINTVFKQNIYKFISWTVAFFWYAVNLVERTFSYSGRFSLGINAQSNGMIKIRDCDPFVFKNSAAKRKLRKLSSLQSISISPVSVSVVNHIVRLSIALVVYIISDICWKFEHRRYDILIFFPAFHCIRISVVPFFRNSLHTLVAAFLTRLWYYFSLHSFFLVCVLP